MSKQLQIPGIGGCLPGELIVDLFAGGGGASTGIEAAVGRPPDIAINHDPAAIKMHEAIHPRTHRQGGLYLRRTLAGHRARRIRPDAVQELQQAGGVPT